MVFKWTVFNRKNKPMCSPNVFIYGVVVCVSGAKLFLHFTILNIISAPLKMASFTLRLVVVQSWHSILLIKEGVVYVCKRSNVSSCCDTVRQ